MSGWNWRLFKDVTKDDKGNEVERIRFQEIWYDKEGKPNGTGDLELTLEQFGKISENSDFSSSKIEYEAVSEANAKYNLRFTLNKLLEALDKPILSKDDFT